MQKVFAGFFVPFLLLMAWSPAPAQELHTYVDRDSVEVGDILTYTLVLQTNEPLHSVRFPDDPELFGEEIRYIEREHHQITALRDSVVYRLQFFGVEDYQIPALPVEVTAGDGQTDTLRTTPVPLLFKTVLAEGEEEYRPLKPIFEFAGSYVWWLLLLLLLALAGWVLYRRYFKGKEEEPEPPAPLPEPPPFIDPLSLLKERLETLTGHNSPLMRREFETFYIQLGDAIRHYIEQVYEIDALEMTSGEILRELRNWPAEKPILESTRNVLQEADMVKFARFEPDLSQAKQTGDTAFEFYEIAAQTDRERIEKMKVDHELGES